MLIDFARSKTQTLGKAIRRKNISRLESNAKLSFSERTIKVGKSITSQSGQANYFQSSQSESTKRKLPKGTKLGPLRVLEGETFRLGFWRQGRLFRAQTHGLSTRLPWTRPGKLARDKADDTVQIFCSNPPLQNLRCTEAQVQPLPGEETHLWARSLHSGDGGARPPCMQEDDQSDGRV